MGEDQAHAGQGGDLGEVAEPEAGVGHGRAQHGGSQRPFRHDVVHVTAVAGDQRTVLLAPDRSAHAVFRRSNVVHDRHDPSGRLLLRQDERKRRRRSDQIDGKKATARGVPVGRRRPC